MAEEQGKAGKGINTGKLATNMQKRLSRAQEKVLQKLGKADETKDTVFEESVANFNKQMVEGTKLQRDLRAYLAAVKTMHDASKRLQDCLADMYEPDWFGKEEVDAIAEETDILWSDYHDKLVDNSMVSMDTYLAQFPDVKARIAKRDRKLTDFDSARHHFASLQKGKKPDQAKIAKPMSIVEKAAPGWAQGILSAHQIAQTNLTRNQAEEELGRAQKVFEEINIELQDELPQLWNSRVGFYVNTFQSMAGYQERFHKDMGKLNQDLNDVMTKLEEQRLAKPAPPAAPPVRPSPSPRPSLTPAPETQQDILLFDSEALVPDANTAAQATAPSQLQPQVLALKWSRLQAPPTFVFSLPLSIFSFLTHSETFALLGWLCLRCLAKKLKMLSHLVSVSYKNQTSIPEYPISSGAWLVVVSWTQEVGHYIRWCLLFFQVKAMHDYAATDGDELELKAGDVVLVLAWDNPDEQDDGWLMGVKESHWLENKNLLVKGVFPENFTQKL
uniref:Myc box-dependent-interacting protein 1 n=1 Tax=Esox lucius TaxID=8010 RepID=A0A6Q2XFY7_ESOLU